MSRFLLLYSSFDGQAEKITRRMGGVLTRQGHSVTLASADATGAFDRLGMHDAVLIGAAVRVGRYSRTLESQVKKHRDFLASMPNAFFSVCLAAAGPRAKREAWETPLRNFCARTGWQPQRCATFAGALRYSRYNPFIRLMMRFIVSRAGGDTDWSRDYEYTDWAAVDGFAAELARTLVPHAQAA